MKNSIHIDTIQRYISERYGVETGVFCREVISTDKFCMIIAEKGSDITMATFKSGENNKNEDTVVLINSEGERVSNDCVYMFTIGEADIFRYNPEKWHISKQHFESGSVTIAGNKVNTDVLNELETLELQKYPNSTGIVIKAMLGTSSELSQCMIDKITDVGNDTFDSILSGQNSEILSDYNTYFYDRYPSGRNTLLVLNKNTGDGLLIDTQGYDYARYLQYIPKISYYINEKLEVDLEQRSTQTIKLYSPLFVRIHDRDNEEYYDNEYWQDDVSSTDATAYYNKIMEAINNTRLPNEGKRGLAVYIDDEAMKRKVFSMYPTIEIHKDELFGVMEIKTAEKLSDSEIQILKEESTGQYSDGWGEGFEQNAIKVENGELYVSFWDFNNFYIRTESEFFEQEQTQQQGEGISGMSM